MSRIFKGGFYLASALLLAATLLLALEVFTRWRIPIDRARVVEATSLAQEQAAKANLAYLQQHSLPTGSHDAVPLGGSSGWPARFATAVEEERMAIASTERAWFFISTVDGVILDTYPPAAGEDDLQGLPEATASIARNSNATALLGDEESKDWLATLSDLSQHPEPAPRYYDTRFLDGTGQTLEWLPRLSDSETGNDLIIVRVRMAIWQRFGFRFRPNIYIANHMEHFGRVPFRTNAQGWRDDEMELPKPQGIYRIVCVGGSTTAGGPRGDLTYPNILERKLRERFKTDRIEVANCGVYAASSATVRMQLDDYMQLQPDLVIQYNFINDFLPTHDQAVFGGWLGPLRSLAARSTFVRYYANHLLRPSRELISDFYRSGMLENFRATAQAARAAGAEVAFGSFGCPSAGEIPEVESEYFLLSRAVLWCSLLDSYGYSYAASVFAETLADFCDEEHVHYLPVYENVRGGLEAYMDMCHMNLPAMDQMAETIENTIAPIIEQGLTKLTP